MRLANVELGCYRQESLNVSHARIPPMLSQKALLDLIARIYDAAADQRLWTPFLEDFANIVEGTTTAVLCFGFDLPAPRARFEASIRMDPQYARLYGEYYSTIDPWIIAHHSLVKSGSTSSIATSEEHLKLAELERTEFCNDYLLPQDTIHQIGCLVTERDASWSGLTCLRPRKKGPFGSAEVKLVGLLLPHLKRAMQFHLKVAELEGQNRVSLSAMDSLPIGILLLDRVGRVVTLNKTAQRVLDQNDGLTASREGLLTASARQTRILQSTVAAAALTAAGHGLWAGGALGILRPSGKRPYLLLAMPAPPDAFPYQSRRPATVVFVSDPDEILQTAAEVFASIGRLFGLTPAESKVASLLTDGKSVEEISDLLLVTHNTTRAHLKRIFSKTGTRRQGELIRLFLSSPAAVRR